MFAGIFSCTPSFSPEINKVYLILFILYLIMFMSEALPFSPAARGGNLAKILPNQVIDDFGRGSSVESESE